MGIVLAILILIAGATLLQTSMLYFRLLMGIGLGYALTRSFMGFAGSVNRAYVTGSTQLMKSIMIMFVLSAILTVGVLYNKETSITQLWINPINLGLFAGGILFGVGMSFSACCASGVLTDIVTGFPRAFITLIFFCIGVFFGFPLQKSQSWITTSWVISSSQSNGVFLPDWFRWDGLEGYLGASLFTALLAGLVIFGASKYEQKRRRLGTFTEHALEKIQEEAPQLAIPTKLFSKETYEIIFVKPWPMMTGVVTITGVYLLLMEVTGSGWGASTAYGFWFGKVLMAFGISPDTLAEFTLQPVTNFTTPFFQHSMSVQNFGIVLGTLLALLLAGTFTKTFVQSLKIRPLDVLLFAIGGLMMGFGTRLANGCNAGALYTPIANFSFSGWIFFGTLVVGGFLGNSLGTFIAEKRGCSIQTKKST